MTKHLVLSPHHDDAVWSIGRTLARLEATVVTVFSRTPPEGLLTAFDQSCGFTSSAEAVRLRRLENQRACTLLDVDCRDGAWLDGQYGTPTTEAELGDWFASQFKQNIPVIAPLGIQHHDHRIVACAARDTARRLKVPVFVYEELPYRVLDPEETVRCLGELRETGWRIEPAVFPQGDRTQKRAAVECYQSQLTDDIRDSLTVPERLWRLTWPS